MGDNRFEKHEAKNTGSDDTASRLLSDATQPMPTKVENVEQQAAKVAQVKDAAPDYSGESQAVQDRMNVPPQQGLDTANANIKSLTASISNSPEGIRAAAEGMKASMDFFKERTPSFDQHVGK
ncbi:MAG: hypothetical protein JSS83_04975 [Cyanobacteria bacterium SZAS LIN-3]|nr:hypothetical protein [Cyanobacteria bacterium SZAS LIN-3]MBS2010398.1 hypothetical protein [Cyanobacteria bacterium SZAS TMP-1]